MRKETLYGIEEGAIAPHSFEGARHGSISVVHAVCTTRVVRLSPGRKDEVRA